MLPGKNYYAMILSCRNSSNTAQNILKNEKSCAINFYQIRKAYLKKYTLGFPGETSKEKMEKFMFTFEPASK